MLALLIFSALVFVHELGHYIAARLCRVKVLEFAIGMGPKLFKWTSKKTGIVYSIRMLPVGGFCSMEGEGEYDNMEINKTADAEHGTENTSDAETEGSSIDVEENADLVEVDNEASVSNEKYGSYKNKPAWVKLIILFAGPVMNIVLGFVLTFVLVIGTRSNGSIQLGSTVIYDFNAYAVSQQSGLCVDDKIIKVGNVPVHTATELSYEIMMQGKYVEYYDHICAEGVVKKPVVKIDLTVIRDGEKTVLEDVVFLASSEQGTTFGNTDFRVYRENDSVGNVLKHAWFRSISSVKMVWDSLIGMITGRFGVESVSGPVGTTQIMVEAAQSGWYTLLYLVTVISMNLGVFNLLPFLPLDGGHIVFSFYELVARRPAPRKLVETCQIAGVLIMIGLMIVIAIKDVINLF